jgi:hypothetical protein
MRTLSSLVAVVSLILTVAFIPVVGGVIFSMVFFGLFLLALVGVVGGVEDRTVRQSGPARSVAVWRSGWRRAVSRSGSAHARAIHRSTGMTRRRGRGPCTGWSPSTSRTIRTEPCRAR